jgi:hypothetical protein
MRQPAHLLGIIPYKLEREWGDGLKGTLKYAADSGYGAHSCDFGERKKPGEIVE